MRFSRTVALMLLLAAVVTSKAQEDYNDVLESLGLDDDDIDIIESASGPEVEAFILAQSPEITQQIIGAFAPYGIDVYAPEPAVEAQTEALSPDQATGLFESLLNIFTSPSPPVNRAPSGRKLQGRKLRQGACLD